MIKRKSFPLAALAAGVLTATLSLSQPGVTQAQDNPTAPPPPPAVERDHPLPPGPRDGGPGPRGERPPRPEADLPPAQPVDPMAAPLAVKTASDALANLSVGQVWTRIAPRGEQQVQASLLFQGKAVARLELDPASGSLQARGQHLPPPPAGPDEERGPVARKNKPTPDASKAEAPPVAPVNLDQVKAKLAETFKGLSVGQGAEIMPREGFWKVPIISENRVVGELHISGDGKTIMPDLGAIRDAAVFAK